MNVSPMFYGTCLYINEFHNTQVKHTVNSQIENIKQRIDTKTLRKSDKDASHPLEPNTKYLYLNKI